jgi:hypothetical protein
VKIFIDRSSRPNESLNLRRLFNGKKVMMYEFVFDICDKTDDLRPFVMATDFNDSGCGIFWAVDK